MSVENLSDNIVVAHLRDDPQFTEDLREVEQAISRTGKNAVLDMSAVQFINSANLARLLTIRKLILNTERRAILCGISKTIWETFTITGLDKVFEFSPDLSTALPKLQAITHGA